MKYIILLLTISSFLLSSQFYYEFDKKIEMQTKLESSNDILMYETIDGETVKFKNEIIVRCNTNAYCEDDFSDLVITDYKEVLSGVFLIKVNKDQDIFDLSQKLYFKNDIKSASPNHVSTWKSR